MECGEEKAQTARLTLADNPVSCFASVPSTIVDSSTSLTPPDKVRLEAIHGPQQEDVYKVLVQHPSTSPLARQGPDTCMARQH